MRSKILKTVLHRAYNRQSTSVSDSLLPMQRTTQAHDHPSDQKEKVQRSNTDVKVGGTRQWGVWPEASLACETKAGEIERREQQQERVLKRRENSSGREWEEREQQQERVGGERTAAGEI